MRGCPQSSKKGKLPTALGLERQQDGLVLPVPRSWGQMARTRTITRTACRSWDRGWRNYLVGTEATEETQLLPALPRKLRENGWVIYQPLSSLWFHYQTRFCQGHLLKETAWKAEGKGSLETRSPVRQRRAKEIQDGSENKLADDWRSSTIPISWMRELRHRNRRS